MLFIKFRTNILQHYFVLMLIVVGLFADKCIAAVQCPPCSNGYIRCPNCFNVCGMCMPSTMCNYAPDCTGSCPSECQSFSWMTAAGKSNVQTMCVKTADQSSGKYSYSCKYQCKDNYFQSGGTDTNPVCSACVLNATCKNGSIICNSGYYLFKSMGFPSIVSCPRCPQDYDTGRYGTSAAGATSEEDCYIPSGLGLADDYGKFTYTSNCKYKK